MTPIPPGIPRSVRPPLYYWGVGLLILLWNCWALFGAVAAQIRLFPEMPAEAVAHLDRQPLWLMLVGDLSLISGVAGSLALLVQSRWAPSLFVAQIAVLMLANGYEVVAGTSPLIGVPETRAGTAILFALLAAQTLYARRMDQKGYLS